MSTPIQSIEVELKWNPWSEKSKDISFNSYTTGVGDGEDKVACELETPTLGQNSPYDMEPIINGVKTKCDVKKLDTQNDFNTGKKGRDIIRPIKYLHINLLNSMIVLSESTLFTPDERSMLNLLQDVSPDELSVGKLHTIDDTCKMLYNKKQYLRSKLPSIPVTILGQTKEVTLDIYYDICNKIGLSLPDELSSYKDELEVLKYMDNPYIDRPTQFMEDLNSLISKIFNDIKIIIVDKQKGYMILENIHNIQFYRITRGNPRFKVIL
jgi:hypothetical protein